MKTARIVALAASFSALMVLPQARAANRFWTNTHSGSFTSVTNWSGGLVPGPADNANFTSNASYYVSWPTGTGGIVSTNANAFFNGTRSGVGPILTNTSWRVTNSFVLGQSSTHTGSVTMLNGELQVTNAARTGRLIVGQDGYGYFDVRGGVIRADRLIATNNTSANNSTFYLVNGFLETHAGSAITDVSVFFIGQLAGSRGVWSMLGGTNTIRSGVGMTALGHSSGSSGEVLVTGAGTLWSNSGQVVVGDLGTNSHVRVQAGARASSEGIIIGSDINSSNNVVEIRQTGSLWTNSLTGSVNVGRVQVGKMGSSNRLEVTSGGKLISAGGLVGVDASSSNNFALVTGFGSVWMNEAELTVGVSGPANTLLVSTSATVVADSIIISANSNAFNNVLTVAGANLVGTNSNDAIDLLNVGRGNRGTLNFNGGNITVGTLLVTNNSAGFTNSIFNFTTGTLTTFSNTTLAPRRGFTLGNTAGKSATWNVSGGRNVVKNFAGFNTVLGSVLGATGIVNVAGAGTVWSNSAQLIIGDVSSGNRLDIGNGAVAVNTDYAIIGNGPNSSNNLVEVGGSNALWQIFADLIVGESGRSNEIFSAGLGRILVDGSTIIGDTATSDGNDVYIGTDMLLAATNNIYVGNNGSNNTLEMYGRGVAANIFVGNGNGSANNSLTVGNAADLEVTNVLRIGSAGSSNQMVVTFGAVRSETGRIGDLAGARGNTVIIGHSGCTWTNNGILTVGNNGPDSLLLITNGGVVFSGNANIGVSGPATNSTAIVADTNSIWNNLASFQVGGAGGGSNNQLQVLRGGALVTSSFLMGGSGPGNSVLIDGPGSGLICANTFQVGNNSVGNRLTVSNRGQALTGSLTVGTTAIADANFVTVVGANSLVRVTGALTLGSSGAANQLTVANGATLTSSNAVIGSAAGANNNVAIVADPGSIWSTTNLVIGESGSRNSLIISNGAWLSSPTVIIGSQATSSSNIFSVNGTVIVTDAGGTGNLDVRRGQVDLNGGSITTHRLLLTNGLTSVFTFNSGILNVHTSLVNSAQTFFVGDGAGAATFHLLRNGTHSFANGLNVRSHATVSGNGTISGTVTVENGGTLSPGLAGTVTPVGTLALNNPPTLQGQTVMEVGKDGSTLTNDQVQLSGTLSYGGSLTAPKIGATPLSLGDQFPLFRADGYAGAFSSISLPPLDAGLMWTNKLLVDGSIQVVPLTPPKIASSALSGTNLVVNGSGGSPGTDYIVLTSTNVALPLTNWPRLLTNQFDWLGNFVFSNGISLNVPQQFYLLQAP